MHLRSPRPLSLFIATVLCIASVGPIVPAAAAQSAKASGVSLSTVVSGDTAIEALGTDLAAVAADHGKTAAQLARALRQDSRLFVDRQGRLFYREAPLPAGLAADTPTDPAPWMSLAGYSLAETFVMHSKPGAKRTVYLDFDGHTLSGTTWNSYNGNADIVAPAWDIDGNPTAFGDTERTRIQQVWQRVAEDYAPFDVDVTTQRPEESALTRSSSADDTYGMRVLISPISSYFGAYGGIAYVGTFDNVGDYYKPALVFPERLSNAAKYIGEAAAHEAGHTGGLLHDGVAGGTEYYAGHGTGETGWAPIMGSGYSRNVTQWSRGEYPNASNTEDDFVVAAANGLALRTDDHPNTPPGAAMLAGSVLGANGIVERASDVDVISVTSGAGLLSLAVAPASTVMNLDVALELRDGAGVLIAQSNPGSQLASSISAEVSGGVYHLYIRGTGEGDVTTGYSDYASVGAWQLTGSAPVTTTALPPVAHIGASTSGGVAPLSITFDGSGSTDPDGTIVEWNWDFGDGALTSGAVVNHTFVAAGTHTVELAVIDGQGVASTATTTVTIAAPNVAPTATIGVSGARVAPATLSFTGASSTDPDGIIVSWAWDFGDGTAGSGATVSHPYANAGTYLVKLTVTDDKGATAATSDSIRIDSAPALVPDVAKVPYSDVSVQTDPTTVNPNLSGDGGSTIATPRMKPVYRFQNRSNGTYLYTSSIEKRNQLLKPKYAKRWAYSGQPYSWDAAVPTNQTVPVYAFKNRTNGEYAYTASRATYEARRTRNGRRTWEYKGIAYRVSRSKADGAVTVYRFKNRRSGASLLTASQATVKRFRSGPTLRRRWEYKGAIYYLRRTQV